MELLRLGHLVLDYNSPNNNINKSCPETIIPSRPMFLTLLDRELEAETSNDSAALRVLGVGELLENILLFADKGDALRSRLVSQKFREVITYSKPLRQKLFLEPGWNSERTLNSLAPTWYILKTGYRQGTIAAQLDLVKLWDQSRVEPRPLWHQMLISQPPAKTCVIPITNHSTTIFFRRDYPDGITFGDLERAALSAFEIRKGRRSSRERLEELSLDNAVLIYWS